MQDKALSSGKYKKQHVTFLVGLTFAGSGGDCFLPSCVSIAADAVYVIVGGTGTDVRQTRSRPEPTEIAGCWRKLVS